MSTRLDDSAIAVRYLLGGLSEQEEKSFEDSFFADDEVFEDLKISEAEVIDAYVANELTERQRQYLEQRLASSPRLQQRVAFARTLAHSIAPREPVQDPEGHDEPPFEPWWRRLFAVPLVGNLTPAGAFASLLIVIAVGGVVVQSVRLRSESRRLGAERAELARQRDELARFAATERDRASSELQAAQQRYERAEELVKSFQQHEPREQPPRQPILATLSLLPGSTRSGGNEQVLEIPLTATEVRLEIILLRIDYHTYQITIDGPASQSIHRTGVRPTTSKTLALRLPAKLFRPGSYTVKVSGVTSSGNVEFASDYGFRVVRK